MVTAPIRWMLFGIQTCVEVRQQNQNPIWQQVDDISWAIGCYIRPIKKS